MENKEIFLNSIENVRAELSNYFHLVQFVDKSGVWKLKRVCFELKQTVLEFENENGDFKKCIMSDCIYSKEDINEFKEFELKI